MVEYEDFKKGTLYELARNGGTRNEIEVRKRFKRLDSLDYHLHLRQLQDDGLLERRWTKASSTFDELMLGSGRTVAQPYLELTDSGWSWVRKNRQQTESVPDVDDPDPSSDPGPQDPS